MVELVNQPEVCVHCGTKFRLAKTLISHICERKRRHLQQSEKRVQTGMQAFNKFYQLTQNCKKNKTYDEFCASSFYNAFVKFGSFVNNVNVLYPEQFIEHIIKSGAKLDHWCKDELYAQYLYNILKIEPTESAIQRSLLTMMQWGDDNSLEYTNYFSKASLNRTANDIINGHVSLWVILNTSSGKKMINNFTDEHLKIIAPAFDLHYWKRRFKEKSDDVTLVKEVCKEAGIP